MTTDPPDAELTPAEAGIWAQGFDPEDAPAPLTGAALAEALADIDLDAPEDYSTDPDEGVSP